MEPRAAVRRFGSAAVLASGATSRASASYLYLKLPDTGQTQSYTSTFGEDSDYNTFNQPSYTDNGDGTITDNVTGLIWQQGEGGTKTWENAITYCEDLSLAGYADWRLPNKNELNSIIDYERYNPAININFCPDLLYTSYYWSSTTRASSSSDAWIVGFLYGDVGYYLSKPTNNYYVRCVRAGQ